MGICRVSVILYMGITFVKAYESEIPGNCYCQIYELALFVMSFYRPKIALKYLPVSTCSCEGLGALVGFQRFILPSCCTEPVPLELVFKH